MYCDNCGVENRDDANFCYKCSQKLSHVHVAGKAVAAVATGPISPALAIDEKATQEQIRNILGGRYELKDILGRGGMGVVYRARDRQLGMDVAIKFLLDNFVNDIAAVESLKREAKAAMRLAHPNIIRLYNFENTADVKYLLMEFVNGESLAAIAMRKPNRRFAESEVIKYISEVCEALKYAHAENVIHRDIKPSNILALPDGRIKLADFGVAHIKEVSNSHMTQGGGTPVYMSPEQILEQKIDGRSDVYSLGITMYEMLTGRPPFRGADVGYHHVHTTPEPMTEVSDWMNTVVLKCLRKEPDGRWHSAEELKDVLTRKKEIGIAFKGNYQPEWLRADDQRKMSPPKTPPPKVSPEDTEPPELERVAVYKSPPPFRSSGLRERLKRIEIHSGLNRHAPEHEHARMGFGALAGIAAGAIMTMVDRNYSPVSVSYDVLFQLSWLIYGALIGTAIGVAQKRRVKGLLSLTLGVAGGIVAMFFLNAAGSLPALGALRPVHHGALCGAIVGAFLGLSDGIYEKSFAYSVRCFVWGAIGGSFAVGLSWLVRHVFSAFWLPMLDWMVVGGALGFFINMSLAFAKRGQVYTFDRIDT